MKHPTFDWADERAAEMIHLVLNLEAAGSVVPMGLEVTRELIAVRLRILREEGAVEGIDRAAIALGIADLGAGPVRMGDG